MTDEDRVHPNAPAGGGGFGSFRSALPMGLNTTLDAWWRPGPLKPQPPRAVPAAPKGPAIPSSPLWHMGKVATLGSKDSFDLLQAAIDHLSTQGKAGTPFTADEKEFMKELFEALWWGGKGKGLPEAAQLANHYVNGGGKLLEIDAEVYSSSVIVKDTMAAMKVHAKAAGLTGGWISSDKAFLRSVAAKPLLAAGRNLNTQGKLLPAGTLLAEQDNQRLKNTDNRFYLKMTLRPAGKQTSCTWRVDSVYDFEPYAKGYYTNLPLGSGYVLKLPDGLSHHLTTIGVAQDFDYFAEWHETW